MSETDKTTPSEPTSSREEEKVEKPDTATLPPEIGGQKGPEPTRYGDWEKGGIISDF